MKQFAYLKYYVFLTIERRDLRLWNTTDPSLAVLLEHQAVPHRVCRIRHRQSGC